MLSRTRWCRWCCAGNQRAHAASVLRGGVWALPQHARPAAATQQAAAAVHSRGARREPERVHGARRRRLLCLPGVLRVQCVKGTVFLMRET